MNDLRESNFNRLYFGFIIAIISVVFLGSPMITFLFIAMSIIIAIAEMVKVHIDKVELKHNIWKFQVFLFIILLIPIAMSFIKNAAIQISFLKLPAYQSENLPEEISKLRPSFYNFLSPLIALVGIIIAYLGLGKYSTNTTSSIDQENT